MINSQNLVGSIQNNSDLRRGGIAVKGDNAYVHIKFSSVYPTQNSDLKDTPDNYLGVYSDNNPIDSEIYTKYQWVKIKGEIGPQGESTSITGISKINTQGLVDTYRVTLSDNSYYDFNVTNGVGIESVKVNGIDLPITDKGVNIVIPNIYKYLLLINNDIADNSKITIPGNYKVGSNVLEVYFCGEKLVKDLHYKEVGIAGTISNQIQIYQWGEPCRAGYWFEFVVKGEYSDGNT